MISFENEQTFSLSDVQYLLGQLINVESAQGDFRLTIANSFFFSLLHYLYDRYGIVLFTTKTSDRFLADARTMFKPVINAPVPIIDAWGGILDIGEDIELEGIQYTAGLAQVPAGISIVLINATVAMYTRFNIEQVSFENLSDPLGKASFKDAFTQYIPPYVDAFFKALTKDPLLK